MNKTFYIITAILAGGVLASCSDDPDNGSAKEEITPVEIEAPKELSYISNLGLTADEAKVVRGNNAFAWKFFALNNIDNSKNVVVSPLSVSIAMTMMANGAYEDSPVRAEILDVLGFSGQPISDVNSATMKLADGINRLDKDVDVTLANSLWADHKKPTLNPAYITLLKKDFATESYPILEQTFVADVNRWCDVKTKGMIDNILPADFKTPKMAVINATYFKGMWAEKFGFDKDATKNGDFTDANNKVSHPEMMSQLMYFDSRRTEQLEVITLPFGNGNYNFYIIRPNAGVSVDECQKALSNGKWDELIATNPTTEFLDVKMPKFDIDYGNGIKEILSNMGMKQAMSKGDFYFACPDGLEIEKVLHQARLRVNEEGAEASGTTVVIPEPIAPDSGSSTESDKPRPFHLDHPFIYLIAEKDCGTIIFLGCVNSL